MAGAVDGTAPLRRSVNLTYSAVNLLVQRDSDCPAVRLGISDLGRPSRPPGGRGRSRSSHVASASHGPSEYYYTCRMIIRVIILESPRAPAAAATE